MPWKSTIGLAAMMNLVVGFHDAFAKGIGGGLIGELQIGVRNAFDRHLAGQLAGGVGAHAIADHEQMAAAAAVFIVGGQHLGVGVLVTGAAHAHIAECDVLEAVAPVSRRHLDEE